MVQPSVAQTAASSLAAEQSNRGVITVAQLAAEPRQVVKDLAQRGISFQGLFVQDWSKGARAGVDAADGFGRYSFDLTASFDNEKLLGWKGSSASMRLKQHIGEFGEGYQDAAQVISNIDAPSRTSLYELWLQQRLLEDRVRLKVGKIDANSEFAAVGNAGDFLNSSMGFSPTILAFPSYPEPKFGVNVFLVPRKNYGLGTGVFQTAGSGVLTLVEPSRKWNVSTNELDGHVNVGYWRLDGTLSRFDGGQSSVSQGVYAVAEQALWKHALDRGGERRLATFFQVGTADRHVSPVTSHVGGGMVLQAPIAERPADSFGFAATGVGFSPHPAAGFDDASEIILESYYRASITRHVALVQDFQFVRNPGGLESNPNCVVITPRLVVSF